MAETLYPQRQRCKKCGKGFPPAGAIKGLFCTYRCAGMAEPHKNVADAPRWCKTDRSGKWEWKKRFRSLDELPRALKNDPASSTYSCSHCGFTHIGHSRVDLASEKQRVVRTRAELADVLTKARGEATHREIGKKSGLQPIRIKELEDPKGKAGDINVLFKLLAFYRLKLSVVFS